MITRERIALLGECSALFSAWTGPFETATLGAWLAAELGDEEALERPVPHGPLRCQARAPRSLLHVVSGNTPHAAFQALLRGLVVGARNMVKLPSSGLPDFEQAVAQLPPALAAMVDLVNELPPGWREEFDFVAVFGSDETLAWFQEQTPPKTRLLLHGQKLSIALVGGDLEHAARLAAQDVSLFDQQGCLSLHDVYLTAEAGGTPAQFAALLAEEMKAFNEHTPRAPLSPADSGAITTVRESIRFAAASEPDAYALWESVGSTDWTVIHERSPTLKISPLNRVVYVKPWPVSGTREALGPALIHLSTLASHPFDPNPASDLLALGATRFCPLGETQNPSLFWHHDGRPPLASLVTWVDLG